MIEIMVWMDKSLFVTLRKKAIDKEVSVSELIAEMLDENLEGERYTKVISL